MIFDKSFPYGKTTPSPSLMASEAAATRIAEIQNVMPDLHVQPFSNKNESGLKNIENLLKSGLTDCLLGSSGVGKMTLLNNLIGESKFETKADREFGKLIKSVMKHKKNRR